MYLYKIEFSSYKYARCWKITPLKVMKKTKKMYFLREAKSSIDRRIPIEAAGNVSEDRSYMEHTYVAAFCQKADIPATLQAVFAKAKEHLKQTEENLEKTRRRFKEAEFSGKFPPVDYRLKERARRLKKKQEQQ